MYGNVELETVSEVHFRRLLGTTMDPNISLAMDEEDHFCKLILYKEIAESRVRIWDIIILIPNLIFLIFIAVRFNRAMLKLRASSSPIYLAFYGLVVSNILISLIRCVVSMTVNAAATVGGLADKILWVTVRFFLLSTEMSVVIFGLFFGHLDSHSSIRRVLLATSFIALAFTITQGTLELVLPDDTFEIPSRNFYLFGHGGMMFWFCSSLVFTTIYLFILILPWTRLRERIALPAKKSFYIYIGILATVDLTQSIGAGILNYTQVPAGLCVVDLTAALYLTIFTPLVYHTFLSEVFGTPQLSIKFSYKPQVDDAMDEDTVSLPHQQSFSSLKTDSDYIYQVHTPSIHMPLYDPIPLKDPCTAKQRSSLYYLARRQVLSTDWSTRSSSQVDLTAGSSSKAFDEGKKGSERGHDLDKKNLMRSRKLEYSPLSTPNLNADNPAWNFVPDSKIISPTASNFIYTPERRDSNVNLFSPSNDNILESMQRKVKSFIEITAGVPSTSNVNDSRRGSRIRETQSVLSSEYLDQDAELNSKLSINSDLSEPKNPDISLHPSEAQKNNLRLFTSYIGKLSDSNLSFDKKKRQNIDPFYGPSTSKANPPSTANIEEATNLYEIKSPEIRLRSETSSESKLADDDFIRFSPFKQSSFKDSNQPSQLLMPTNLKRISKKSDADGATNPQSSGVISNSSSSTSVQSQSTDFSFFSANKTLNSSNDDKKSSNLSPASSKTTTFYSFENSDNNSKESSGLSDYLKLCNTPRKRTD